MLDISVIQCNQFYVLESRTAVTEMVLTSLISVNVQLCSVSF